MTDEKIAELYREIGTRIRKYREKKGMRPEILAQHLGLTRASIVNLEKGRHKPAIHTLIEIAGLLLIPYTELIPSIQEDKKHRQADSEVSNIITDQANVNYSAEKIIKEFMATISKAQKKKSL